ncbi:MAG TPA: DUF4199 domain-containing protein [Candidatus Kapabacteria bacterium]|nr:DUF4199 domain-containing protein [Candidatus Kapabacteria bacterium]
MSNAVMYGLYVTAANIVLTLIMYFTGLWKSAPAIGYIAFIFLIIAIVMAIKDRRDNENGGEIRFGQAFSTGFTVVLITAILGAIFFFVYTQYINTEFEPYMAEQMEIGMAEQKANMSEAEFEQAKSMAGMMSSPAMMAISQILMSLILGSIVSAICAAILKRDPRPQVMS